MASTWFTRLLPLALCFLLFFHGGFSQLDRPKKQQPHRLGGPSECRIDRITAREPNRRLKHEAGESEFWESGQNDELECAGVEAARHTIQPKGLLLPYYPNTPELVYVVRGRGIQGTVLPGCPETFETSHPSESGEEFLDRHQRVYRYKEGDILALPAGAVHWTYNDGDTPIVTIVLRDISNEANQLDRNFRKFFLAGNTQSRQQGQIGEYMNPQDRRPWDQPSRGRGQQEPGQGGSSWDQPSRGRGQQEPGQDRRPWEQPSRGGGQQDRRPWEQPSRGGSQQDRRPWEQPSRGGGQQDRKPWEQPSRGAGGQQDRRPWEQPSRGQTLGRRGQQPGGRQGQQGQQDESNIFNGFDDEILQEVFNVEFNTVRQLKGQEDNRGLIVRAEDFQVAVPEEREQDEEANGIEQTICSTQLRANIANPANADVYNPRGGRLSNLNSHKLPILNQLQLSAERGVLYKNAVLAPHYNLNAHSIVYILSGSSRFQIVRNDGSTVFDGEVREGQLIVVPQDFAVVKKAEEEGVEWVAFKTNNNAQTTQLAGRLSVIRGLPDDVVANSYEVTREQAKSLKYNREEGVVLSPTSSGSSRRKGMNAVLNVLFS